MSATPLRERRTAVYRLFADDGALLYVGVSWSPNVRLSGHRVHKAWWPEVERTTTEWYRNRAMALRHEACAIDQEHPRYNITRPDPRGSFAPKQKVDVRFEAPRMSYEHAAAVLRIPMDVLRRATGRGIVPHSCLRDSVWFTPRNLRHFRALYLRPDPQNPYYDPELYELYKPNPREAKRALWLRHCLHAVI